MDDQFFCQELSENDINSIPDKFNKNELRHLMGTFQTADSKYSYTIFLLNKLNQDTAAEVDHFVFTRRHDRNSSLGESILVSFKAIIQIFQKVFELRDRTNCNKNGYSLVPQSVKRILKYFSMSLEYTGH